MAQRLVGKEPSLIFTLQAPTSFPKRHAVMGYVFDFQDARSYAQWLWRHRNHWTVSLQKQLMLKLLKPTAGESVLSIGCGTCTCTQPLLDRGLSVTGIDPSPYMLDIAHESVGRRVDLYRGYAEALPFDDNSFDHAVFFISLEFVNNPVRAMEEACRIAKDRVFIGFLNRYALKGIYLRLHGVFNTTVYNRARFFSPWELKQMIRAMAGPVPISWRTVCQVPGLHTRATHYFEQSDMVQRSPFGAFGGMVVTLMPMFRTRPLTLLQRTSKKHGLVAGGSPVRPLILKGREKEEHRVRGEKAAAG